jgi:hypothetical protein
MEIDIRWGPPWDDNLEGLDGAIQVHVKDGILIVPHPGSWACHFVTDVESAIITWIGLNLS